MLDRVIVKNSEHNALLDKIICEQSEFVTKEELKAVEEKIVIKIRKMIQAIQKRLLDVLVEQTSDLPDFFGHEDIANHVIQDLEGLFLELENQFK